jgi:2-dehydro-3-deoxyphosphogluconate aldolase / (4S)-4-hydroxy-2-oxoglutarate aldolase
VAAERVAVSRVDALADILSLGRVVAVATIERAADAVPLANALCEGGIRVIEVTLRTEAAFAAIEHIANGCQAAIVGAGTALRAADFSAARAAGARFVVSPGFTPALAAAARATATPWLPGVATASEVLLAQEAGHALLKFFPAEAAGGPRALRAFATVFPEVGFCPTGGVTAENVRGYLELPNVVCVGGTWLAPPALTTAQEWSKIQELAARTVELTRAV